VLLFFNVVTQEIVLDIKPKENKLKTYAPWAIAAVLVALAPFLIGFAIGKYTELDVPFTSKETATKSATRKGWYVFETKGFSIEYPKGWEVEKNSSDEPLGAKVETDGGRAQFWFTEEREYRFSDDQKKKQKGEKESSLNVDQRTATVTEYLYKDGDRFIVIETPASPKKTKVIFWIVAANTEYKEFLLEIVSTFKSTKKIEEETKSVNGQNT
jgi:hypothetical protein